MSTLQNLDAARSFCPLLAGTSMDPKLLIALVICGTPASLPSRGRVMPSVIVTLYVSFLEGLLLRRRHCERGGGDPGGDQGEAAGRLRPFGRLRLVLPPQSSTPRVPHHGRRAAISALLRGAPR